MRQCLTSPEGGYYTSAQEGRDQFGTKGDFITSPEISQIFGELIGVWMVAEWMAQGSKGAAVELIEVGPGRGTLMDDMLRTIRNFKPLQSSIEAVYLVESSPVLREAQKQLLCGDAPMEETSDGFRSRSKYSDLPVVWCEDIRFVPKDTGKSPFIVAHEFFDALPVHVFQSVAPSQSQIQTGPTNLPPKASAVPQWRELLVSPTSPYAASATTAGENVKEFEMSLAKASTPNSLVMPETSERYKALKGQAGSTIEVCPEGQSYAEEFARRIGGNQEGGSGAALIIDYGPATTIPVNSLRGIRSHQSVSPFSSPGRVDISADVDFTGLAEAALRASENVEVHGPAEQGYFLQAMGIQERATQLLKSVAATDEEKRKRLESGWKRLVERGGGAMGKIYKAMAIVPLSKAQRRPVGFGGDVAA
ncbi:MAG: hypothetical protein M4579_006247 [Chaenotheca gracillima]|nr:MAG: hypothetical protein M4579_006247 [Chaenotheca gracillima]